MNKEFKELKEDDLEQDYESLKSDLKQLYEECEKYFSDEALFDAVALDDEIYISLNDINDIIDTILECTDVEKHVPDNIDEKIGMDIINIFGRLSRAVMNKYDVTLALTSD